mmetsp:Transcript_9366/g.24212  ORF Transcript_9366/g.24212 Transcript_9366/m.24212 type:complete len:281 (-) Transcript_9366:210-1052(-)
MATAVSASCSARPRRLVPSVLPPRVSVPEVEVMDESEICTLPAETPPLESITSAPFAMLMAPPSALSALADRAAVLSVSVMCTAPPMVTAPHATPPQSRLMLIPSPLRELRRSKPGEARLRAFTFSASSEASGPSSMPSPSTIILEPGTTRTAVSEAEVMTSADVEPTPPVIRLWPEPISRSAEETRTALPPGSSVIALPSADVSVSSDAPLISSARTEPITSRFDATCVWPSPPGAKVTFEPVPEMSERLELEKRLGTDSLPTSMLVVWKPPVASGVIW